MKNKYIMTTLMIEITQRCNANCAQCGSRCTYDSEDLITKEDIIKALEDIKKNIGTSVMINITGGEPLLRKDLFNIMDTAHKMGFDWGIVSNGLLITDDVVNKMKQTGMKTISVSIDGIGDTHNKLRGLSSNGYRTTMKNIKRLQKANFLDELQVTFTANSKNYKELIDVYKELDLIGVDTMRVGFIDPIGRAEEHQELMLTREQMLSVIRDFNKLKHEATAKTLTDKLRDKLGIERHTQMVFGCPHFLNNLVNGRGFYCMAGKEVVSILYNGDICSCPNIPRRKELIQGNIKTDSITEVWNTGFKQFRERTLPKKCVQCEHLKKCNGDSFHTFDFDKNEPKFCYKQTFQEKIQNIEEKYRSLGYGITEIGPDETDINYDESKIIYILPQAYQDIKSYFHFGTVHPESWYEQQMGMIGTIVDNQYIVRYVFPSSIDRLAPDKARFNTQTLRQITFELKAARDGMKIDKQAEQDNTLPEELRFIGFIHSHNILNNGELIYSEGDVDIHKKMLEKFGNYVGILVHPQDELIGAYEGKEITQATLRIFEEYNPLHI